jgi:hypothetical protein
MAKDGNAGEELSDEEWDAFARSFDDESPTRATYKEPSARQRELTAKWQKESPEAPGWRTDGPPALGVTPIPQAARRGKARRNAAWMLLAVVVTAGVVGLPKLLRHDDPGTPVALVPPSRTATATSATTATTSPVPPPTTSSASAQVGNATSPTATDTSTPQPGKCVGSDCGKLLMGDWSTLGLGDCFDFDETATELIFTKKACTSDHDDEVYFDRDPDNEPMLQPGESVTHLDERSCPHQSLVAYAPSYAARHPDSAEESGQWGDGTKHICAVVASVPDRSIKNP